MGRKMVLAAEEGANKRIDVRGGAKKAWEGARC